MTYRQLADWLAKMNVENLDSTVTVRISEDEWLPIVGTAVQSGDDVLDDGHPYMVGANYETAGGND